MKRNASVAAILLAVLSFPVSAAAVFHLTSQDISNDGRLADKHVFNGFGCHGENTSPHLAWNNPPAGTKSFAVTVFDPDAPTGSGWWHWTVVNIPAQTQAIPSGVGAPQSKTLPVGAVQGRNDFGYAGFGGACPPEGDKAHAYRFTVWALDVDQLPVDSSASGALVGFLLNSHVLAKAQLTVTYQR